MCTRATGAFCLCALQPLVPSVYVHSSLTCHLAQRCVVQGPGASGGARLFAPWDEVIKEGKGTYQEEQIQVPNRSKFKRHNMAKWDVPG